MFKPARLRPGWEAPYTKAAALVVLNSDGQLGVTMLEIDASGQYAELCFSDDEPRRMTAKIWGKAVETRYRQVQLLEEILEGLKTMVDLDLRMRMRSKYSPICPECLMLPYGDDDYLCDLHINQRMGLG